MSEFPQFITGEASAEIRREHPPLEIEPGVTVADLKTVEDCDRAREMLTIAMALIDADLETTNDEMRAGRPRRPPRTEGCESWVSV